MSILVALTCEEWAVVATDSRAISPGNNVEDDHPKTLCLRGGRKAVIGCFNGLLTVRDLPVATYVAKSWLDATSLDGLATACADALKRGLDGSAVGLDLVLMASPNLDFYAPPQVRWINFTANMGAISAKIEQVGPKFVTGDASARDSINAKLDAQGWGPGEEKLRADAREAILLGMERCGEHAAGIKSCGGLPSIEGLTLGKRR